MSPALLAAALTTAGTLPRASAHSSTTAVEVDRAVARVEFSVVTLSELLAEARLTLLRAGGLASERLVLTPERYAAVLAALAGEPPDDDARDTAELLASVLAQIVQRELLLGEVRRLQLRDVLEEEVRAAYQALLALGPDRARMRAALESAGFGRSEDALGRDPPRELASVLRAELSVRRLVELRARSSAAPTDAEVAGCVAALAERGRDVPRELLVEEMRLARLTARLAELVTQLEGKVEVRYAPPFAARPPQIPPTCPAEEAPR